MFKIFFNFYFYRPNKRWQKTDYLSPKFLISLLIYVGYYTYKSGYITD